MPSSANNRYAEQLAELVADSVWLMQALRAVRALGLQSWCIGAGAVRGLVWDHLHGFSSQSPVADVDVVFFDPENCSSAYEHQLKNLLVGAVQDLEWEVVNQAAVHHWFQTHLSQSVPPLASLEEGIASWPEYATCVGVFLEPNETVRVVAPHGLDDLFNMVVRRNPTRVPASVYRERVAQKRFSERWPRVKVLPAENVL
jgi:hypothetical protein